MNNFKNNIIFIIKIVILFLSCYLVYVNLKVDQIPSYLKNKFNIENSIFILTLFIISTHLQIYITLKTISKKLIKKIRYSYFAKLFLNSQVISIILPHSGLVYRAYHLKKLELSYTDFLGVSYFLAWFYFFFFLLLYSFEILIFGSYLGDYRYLIFISGLIVSIIIYSLPFIFFKVAIINLKNRILKKIYEYFRYIVLIPIDYKRKKFFNFLYIFGVIGHILNFLLIFSAIKAIGVELSLSQIVIFFVINSFLDQVPITPKNLGISELVFGLTSTNMGLGFEIGFFIKLILRLFSFINLILLVIIYNLLSSKTNKALNE